MWSTQRHVAARAYRLPGAATLTLAIVLASAASAHASAFGDTFSDYKAHGKVDPCAHSQQVLKQARNQIPPDIEQYAPDFPVALDVALQARARGVCAKKGSAGQATPAPSSPGPAATSPPRGTPSGSTPPPAGAPGRPATGGGPAPAPVPPLNIHITNPSRVGKDSGTNPWPLIAIAVIALLLAIPALVWWLARWRGWDPGWLPGARHNLGEASYRLGNGWAEFTDWLRFGH